MDHGWSVTDNQFHVGSAPLVGKLSPGERPLQRDSIFVENNAQHSKKAESKESSQRPAVASQWIHRHT